MKGSNNTTHSTKKTGPASPEVGAGTHSYTKKQGGRNLGWQSPVNKSKKGSY